MVAFFFDMLGNSLHNRGEAVHAGTRLPKLGFIVRNGIRVDLSLSDSHFHEHLLVRTMLGAFEIKF